VYIADLFQDIHANSGENGSTPYTIQDETWASISQEQKLKPSVCCKKHFTRVDISYLFLLFKPCNSIFPHSPSYWYRFILTCFLTNYPCFFSEFPSFICFLLIFTSKKNRKKKDSKQGDGENNDSGPKFLPMTFFKKLAISIQQIPIYPVWNLISCR